MIEMVTVEYVDGDAAQHEHEVQWYGTPPQHPLPTAHFQIPQYTDADKQAGHSAR